MTIADKDPVVVEVEREGATAQVLRSVAKKARVAGELVDAAAEFGETIERGTRGLLDRIVRALDPTDEGGGGGPKR